MKKYLFSFIAIVIPMAIFCQGNIDYEKEKAAIIAVIEQETNAYINADYESWKATYAQNDPFVRINVTQTSIDGANNWQLYDSSYYAYYSSNPDPLTITNKNENYIIRIVTPESAWAVYVENWFDSEGTRTSWGIHTRFLEKQNGEWKINYLEIIDAASFETETVEE